MTVEAMRTASPLLSVKVQPLDVRKQGFPPDPSASSVDEGAAEASVSSDAGRPNLTLHVDTSGDITALGSSVYASSNGRNAIQSWQQPYSELSRFPSASYRSARPGSARSDAWQAGLDSRFMTPLPSPLEARSRTLSDAASDTSSVGGASTSSTGHHYNVNNGTQSAGSREPHQRPVPSRTKTSSFFESMDTAFSPPPPPRIASANYDHSKRNSLDGSSGASSQELASPPLTASTSQQSHHSEPWTRSAVLSASSPASASPSTPMLSEPLMSAPLPLIQPLSGLPSNVRSELNRTTPVNRARFGAVRPAPLALDTQPQRQRVPSAGGSSSSTSTPIASTSNLLGRYVSVNESPLASPTDSQSSKWAREPPARLPTLFPDSSGLSSFASPGTTPVPISSMSLADSPEPSTSAGSTASEPSEMSRSQSPASQAATPGAECECGAILNGSFEVIRGLGVGAFSRVVLGKRLRPRAAPSADGQRSLTLSPKKPANGHKKSVSGSYPAGIGLGHIRVRSLGTVSAATVSSKLDQSLSAGEGEESSAENDHPRSTQQTPESSHHFEGTEDTGEKLVAIKLINRSHIMKNDRMRISIVREVEVLKHIRHPSLIHLTSYFDTAFHTCLVLEYSPGGELFDFLANYHDRTSEALARRIFGELADALGWMHSIGLVHRDIKLENILLTSRPFSEPPSSGLLNSTTSFPEPSSLPSLPTPFIKLTDFGLSRFIDKSSPYLETRCGSEEYAAPELIMGKRYDGRQTDAWALGVVLYAITTGYLPFVEDGGAANGTPAQNGVSPSAKGSAKSRRAYLLRIAKGEYSWPEAIRDPEGRPKQTDSTRLIDENVKKLVSALLMRDPKKRLSVEDVWEYDWMSGPGAPEKRSVRGGTLEGVSVTEFGRDDEEVVRAEVPAL